MNLDYTLDKYRELCENICSSGYSILTVKEYLESKNRAIKFVVLRHDIERNPTNALKTAKIENDLKIHSTYYFRTNPSVFKEDVIGQIKGLGHEIGYHYEVLSTAKGNYEKAVELFEYELNKFRKIYDVKTISMHGKPLSKYDNRNLWKVYDFTDFGIIGEAYLSAGKDVSYFSDTGRSWNSKNNLRDFMPGKREDGNVDTTDNLIELVKSNKINRLYISTHPERWASNNLEWCVIYMTDLAFNAGKKVLVAVRG